MSTKKSKKIKTPNYHAMVFAAIIIVMSMLFLNRETTQYVDIAQRRNDFSRSVRTGSLDLEAIQTGYEQYSQDMERLGEMSRLGSVLAELDQSGIGQICNCIIVYSTRMLVLYMCFFILRELYWQAQIIWSNINRIKKAQKEKRKKSLD